MRNTSRTRLALGATALGLACATLYAVGVPAQQAEPKLDAAARARLERLIVTRGFTRGLPANATPSPDGRQVYFLRSGPTDRYQVLYVMDVASGATRPFLTSDDLGGTAVISKEEQSRRERQRQTERGITSFQLSRDGQSLLLPFSGDLWLAEAGGGAPRPLTRTPEPELDAHFSPDGRRVAFVRGRDLFALDVATGHETTVAHSDDPSISLDRKSTRLNSSHLKLSRMPSSA